MGGTQMGNAKWPDCDLMLTLKPNFHHHDPLVYWSLLTGKAERGPYSSFATQVNQSERRMFFLRAPDFISTMTLLSKCPLYFMSLCFLSYGLQQGFMPSEIAMPSPNAISPSGLKPNSQFYSYEGSNPRRRPQQDPIGKIIADTVGHRLHGEKKRYMYKYIFYYIYIIYSTLFCVDLHTAAGVCKKNFHFCMANKKEITKST